MTRRHWFKAAAAIALACASAPAFADEKFDAMIADAKAQMMADPTKAAEQARNAEGYAARLSDRSERTTDTAAAKWLQGEAALRLNAPDRAAQQIEAALTLLKGTRPTKLHGDLMLSRGGVNAALGHVGQALADYQAAHRIYQQLGETRSQAITLITIGTLYKDADDFGRALVYYDRALDVYKGDPGLLVAIYTNRGGAFKDLHRYREAEEASYAALRIAREIKSAGVQAQIWKNIARLQADQGKLDAADHAVANGLRIAPRDAASWPAQFAAISAETALRRNDLARAETMIRRTFAGVDLTTSDVGYREAHYIAYRIYTARKDERQALVHLQAMKRLDDQIWKLTASNNNALMAARFDSANQEARISKLKAEEAARKLAMERAQVRFQRILFGSIGAAALLVLGLLALGLVQSRRARVRLSLSNTALEKALAAKTEFLATTSHEIRTPLNGILGMTQVMLADPRLDPTLKDRVGIVQEAGLTMRSLVDDILDVAKMETGNLTVEARPFDLKAMLEDVTRMWAEQARAKGLDFRLELADCPRGLMGDAGRVRQVVYNLLSNAVKFTAAGSVTVRADCAGDRLRIAVIDTGIGIAPDKHDEIFESFKQADGGTTRQFGGTGLGLAIVKNIATAMEGSVTVDSALDAGATFTVDLPYVAAELAAPAPAAASGGLLVVDRNPIARAMLKAVLEPRAGSVVFANSCAEAIDLAAKGGVERILVDEAAARADDADPLAEVAALAAAAGLPVAVLWANPDDAVRAALAAGGVAQVIAKPVAGPTLAAALYSDNTQEALVTRAA